MRRRYLILFSLLLAVLLGLSVYWESSRPRPNITVQTWQLIEEGMTEEQVVALIGATPGNYNPGHAEGGRMWHFYGLPNPTPEEISRTSIWWGEGAAILVHYGHDNRVHTAQICCVAARQLTWRERVNRLLPRSLRI